MSPLAILGEMIGPEPFHIEWRITNSENVLAFGDARKSRCQSAGRKIWRRNPTTRWTGAAVARLLSGVIGSTLSLLAPPGQLGRYAACVFYERNSLSRHSNSCWRVFPLH